MSTAPPRKPRPPPHHWLRCWAIVAGGGATRPRRSSSLRCGRSTWTRTAPPAKTAAAAERDLLDMTARPHKEVAVPRLTPALR